MPGVVHEHVHPPVGLGRSGDKRVGLLFYGHVGGHGQGFHTELFGDFGGYRLGGGRLRPEELFTTTFMPAAASSRATGASDAAGGAGHHGATTIL